MHKDEVTTTVINDRIIISLGEQWFNKSIRNKVRRCNYSSDHMRRAARLLMFARKRDNTIKTMSDLLTPSFFDIIVDGAFEMAGQDRQTGASSVHMIHPSAALKIGQDIELMSELKEIQSIQDKDAVKEEEAARLLKVMKKLWPTRVATLARCLASERKFNKNILLPIPEDLEKVSNYIKEELANLDLTKPAWTTYQRGVYLVQCRLAIFNKRRPGELEAIRYLAIYCMSQYILCHLQSTAY